MNVEMWRKSKAESQGFYIWSTFFAFRDLQSHCQPRHLFSCAISCLRDSETLNLHRNHQYSPSKRWRNNLDFFSFLSGLLTSCHFGCPLACLFTISIVFLIKGVNSHLWSCSRPRQVFIEAKAWLSTALVTLSRMHVKFAHITKSSGKPRSEKVIKLSGISWYVW